MNDEPRRRGRPPKDTQTENTDEEKVFVEAIVENPIQENQLNTGEDAVAPIVASFVNDESPIEEKIHQLVDEANIPVVQGWENNMRIAPTDGRRVMVSQTGVGQGSLVYWRISKMVDKKNLRYVPKGRWTDFLSKKDIEFIPSYWKPYNPEEYWPLQG